MSFDLSKVQAAVVATAADLNKATKGGGGERVVLAKGGCQMRFVGYIETGAHAYVTKVNGKPVDKCNPHAFLLFEITGPKHPPRVLGEGAEARTVPNLVHIKIKNVSQSDRAQYFKTFKAMNIDGTATHFVQLLGKAYRGTIGHFLPDPKDEKNVIATIDEVLNPQFEHPVDGTLHTIEPPAPLSPIRVFVWDTADTAMLKYMWDSLYIEGSYTVGEGAEEKEVSLNKWQNMICEAANFPESPIEALLKAEGKAVITKERPKLPAADAPAQTTAADDDPLNAM